MSLKLVRSENSIGSAWMKKFESRQGTPDFLQMAQGPFYQEVNFEGCKPHTDGLGESPYEANTATSSRSNSPESCYFDDSQSGYSYPNYQSSHFIPVEMIQNANTQKKATKSFKNEPSYVKKLKTELCKNWEQKGSCKYGDSCAFAHGAD